MTIRNYRVTAKGDDNYGTRTLMQIDVSAKNKADALKAARARSYEYFDRHDYKANSLQWEAHTTEV